MTDITEKIASLSPEKRALLAKKLKEQAQRFNSFPLSFAQQRLWFLDQLAPGNPSYNLPSAFRIHGDLNLNALEQSLNEIIKRHEILRTTFSVIDGTPVQVISKTGQAPLQAIDLSNAPGDLRELEAKKIIFTESQRSFNLTKGPLCYITLVRFSTRDHILLLVMHHIISDGWSMGILIREFSVIYQSLLSGNGHILPDLKIQYADFSQWQRKWLQGEKLEKQISYWREQLQDAPVLKLPTDRPRPEMQTFNGAREEIRLSKNLLEKTRMLSAKEGTTDFMVFLAAFHTFLYRYSGQVDVSVGTPIANRNRAEIEPLIGFFVNTLVIRVNLSGNPGFRELLRRVKHVVLNAFAHQDLPFEMLVEELQPERRSSYAPLFQVMYVPQNITIHETELPGFAISPVELENPTAKFDLTLKTAETKEEFVVSLDYNTDLFDSSTVKKMLDHFQVLLEGIVKNPDQSISTVPLLTETARQQVLIEWNNTELPFPQNLCLHQLFETQVQKTPESIAVIYEDNYLTYYELNQRANQLAHYLRTFGVGPDSLVGIHLERCLDLVVALIATLKAGGAYVPLDLSQPKDRIRYMVVDAEIQVLLTKRDLLGGLSLDSSKIVCMDADWNAISQQCVINPENKTTATNLAYVIYTSGTTGQPKGVAIQHRSVVNLLSALNEAIYQHERDSRLKVSLNGPLAFDTSVKQVIQLLQGHTLYIVPEEKRLDGEALLHFLRGNELDVFDCTPSQLQLLIDAGLLTGKGFVPGHILVGGEPIDEAMWQALARSPETTFHNVYGPTECTVDATVRTIGAMRSLSKNERIRYARQLLLDQWGLDTQERLKSLKVFVAGAGGSGSPIITQLALIGVGAIKICDFDVVDLSNLNRQFLHCVSEESRIGVSKAVSAKKTAHNINPHVRIEIVEKRIDDSNIDEMVGDADVIFDSVDDFVTKFVLSKCAVRKGIPHLFYGMMDINSFGGIFYPPTAPCFHCLFNSEKVIELQELEAFRTKDSPKKLPTPVFCAPVVSSAGFMMTEAMKILLGIGAPAYNKFFFFLQKGNTRIAESRGVQGIRYWMSSHFERHLQEHGLDWEQGGWRHHFVEEITVSPDPNCPNCGRHQALTKNAGAISLRPPVTTVPVIGRPVANTEIYIVDSQLMPVPVGVPGELYIGGAGLARGYLNRPDLTAEKFIPNPFSMKAGARLYKTGDRASYQPDGNIRFFGRIDHQVKVRGYRIELGDIETALVAHPDIQDCVVLVREDSPGDKRLVAYLLATNQRLPSSDDLRAYLKEQLPEYMIPAAFIFMDVFPLTPNGKVDRNALLATDHSNLLLHSAYVAPRTPTEELLADIWCRVLNLKKVSVHDNFFDIGGHSLLGTRLVTRMRDTFKIELPLRTIFESPTISELAKAIDETKLRESGIAVSPLTPVPRKPDSKLPLSFGQLRLWFLDQLEPGSPFYNIPRAVGLAGELDIVALEKSIKEILQRHESLRTIFIAEDGRPAQVIFPELELKIPFVDLEGVPAENRRTMVEQLAREEAQRSFDLARGPLVRVTLLHLGTEDHVIFLVMHHIVSDGWSSGIFIREVATLYNAFSAGNPSPLPALPIQYADYACWQRQWLQGEVLEQQVSYWKKQLADGPPLLELPTDHPRPSVQSYHGKQHYFELAPELSVALKELCSQEGITLFMMLLAAFQTLLYRYSGQEDINVGSPIANRTRGETELLIGFFINTLVFRNNFSGNPRFRELLKRTRELALEAYAHQDLPFEQVVDALQPERNLSHTPLFQVMFVFQNTPGQVMELPKLTLSFIETDPGTAQFDLTLTMIEHPEHLSGSIEYNTDLFNTATIVRLLTNFHMLLKGVVANPDQRVSDVPLLTEVEKELILKGWNETRAEVPVNQCIHHLFEIQAERTPGAVAVVFRNDHLTYQQLNTRANQLAHYLMKLGVGPEIPVGICVERSLEMIIGLLGILKTGAAYVPIDPKYPEDRITYMLEDTKAPVLLTQQIFLAQLPEYSGQVLYLDTDWPVISHEPAENPDSKVLPVNMAYVIFTSGSTGKPKGVQVSHTALVNYVTSAIKTFEIVPEDKILQFASISFDAAGEEIYPCLLKGATLVLRTEEMLGSIPVFLDSCHELGITLLDLPTAYWHQMTLEIASEHLTIPESVRLVILGGERAVPERLLEWKKNVPGKIRLINTYGPTEATIVATQWDSVDSIETAGLVNELPIGKPVNNVRTYVLDRYLNPQPVGVPGELYIGGAGLARGYLNRPDLTAEKFIPASFADEMGGRLYKTGDRVRFLPDGNIEFLGRIDHQVKIRGFRIELGEIEAVLSQHHALKEVIVLAKTKKTISTGAEEADIRRLVAYCVPESGATADVKELRAYLKERLPEYMIPSAFIEIEKVPLTSSGKLDLRALPEPEHTRLELASAFVAPRTALEETLAKILAEVLGLDKVGVNDNFFELGGDSILSIQLIARANQAGIKLTPMQLFQYQTIAELATIAETVEIMQADQGVVTGPVPLTPIQLWFFDQNFREVHYWNQSILLQVHEPMKASVLKQVVYHLMIHHDALRLRFVKETNGWKQYNVGIEESVPFTQIDLAALPAQQQASAIEAAASELQRSLNLAKGPLVRVVYFDLGPQRPGRLLMIIHHLAVDGVSWRILMEDFQTAYLQLAHDKALVLPPKTTSFQHWAQQLQDYARSEAPVSELEYWLAKPQERLVKLPVDYPGGANTEASAENIAVSLTEAETKALLQEVPSVYHTQVNELLVTALVQAFSRWTGKRALLVDLEGHGREEIIEGVDLSRTVGWFTTVYPVLLDLKDAYSPGDAIKIIKEAIRQIPHHGIGYGLLRYLNNDPEIVARITALAAAEVSFNYLGQFNQGVSDSRQFSAAYERIGPDHSPMEVRSYLLDVSGGVAGGQMRIGLTFSKNIFRRSTIERLAQYYLEALQSLVAHCRSDVAGGYTPSDFKLAKLDQKKLDKVLAQLKKPGN